MKFTHATHLLDIDGVQITAGVTRHGEIRMLTASGNTDVARLTPDLADRLAEILRDCARHARGGRYWVPLRGSEPCPRCGAAAGELHREDCGPALREQLTRAAEPDTGCPDCHVSVGAEHTEMCGARDSGQIIWPGYGTEPEPLVIYGPHCSHEECGWITCDGTGLVEHPCRKPGCPHCGAPAATEPEHWATDPARVAAMSPDDQARVTRYLDTYPLVRRGPDDDAGRLDDTPEEEPPEPAWDPGPEIDNEGGMPEYRYIPHEPWS